MAITSIQQLFDALLHTTASHEVRAILTDIGDSSESELDKPFGPLGLQWHAFGNSTSNMSTVGLASKAGRSVTERVTNMFDALLEDRKPEGVVPPTSPRLAAQKWFGRQVTGPGEGLFNWKYASTGIDKRLHLVLSASGNENAPTIDVVDDGIGIAPEHMPETILSLQAGNKITKRYLMGAFGQGGASTLAFSDYCLIVCRSKHDLRRVGFTLVKVLKLGEEYKEDCYAYLALNDNGNVVVPAISGSDEPLDLYPVSASKMPQLKKGVLIRHYSYQLSGVTGKLGPAPGNLYHYLHVSMFDPLFPFRVIDRRDDQIKDEVVTGSRNRLMRLALDKEASTSSEPVDEESSGSEMKHYRPMEFVNPPGSSDPCIGVEYWVVFNYRKKKKGSKEVMLRGQSNELFVHKGHPIVGVLNGQNQGELTGKLLSSIGLPGVAKHIVIGVDASSAPNDVRRQLFSTNREGFKDGPVLDEIIRVLKRMLEEDERLYKLEEEIADRLAKSAADSTSEEVKRQVTKLLADAGIQVKTEGPGFTPGGDETIPGKRERHGRRHVRPDPLPTLPFPEVTRLEVAWPKPMLKVHVGDNETILVETDADQEYDKQGRIAIRFDPPQLEIAGKSPLRGGRIRWRVRPVAEAPVGAAGKIVVTLTKLDGQQIVSEVGYEVMPAIEIKGKKSPDLVPPFEIVPISPDDNPEEWEAAGWADLPEERQSQVAYKIVPAGGKTNVYYSTIFEPFVTQIAKLASGAMVDAFKTNYSIWIGYHAILQQRDRRLVDADIKEESVDDVQEIERATVGKMQVKQAVRAAELMLKAQQTAATEAV
jgi:hypothetical protein